MEYNQETQKNSILYRPSLQVPKDYYADGFLNYPENENLSNTQPVRPQDLITQIETLQKILLFIPGAIRPCVESILDLVRFLLILIEPLDSETEDDLYEITTPDDAPEIRPGEGTTLNPDTDLDKIFSNGHKPSVILREQATEEAKIERNYSRSTLDISLYYIDRLSGLLTDYHSRLLKNSKLQSVLEDVYKEPLLDYSDAVAHSILQTLLKSQKEKDNKLRLYQKLYNEKESLTLLKSLEYSKLTLLKTTGHAPKNPYLYYKYVQTMESEKNKLNKKLFEYYRYLDSSLDALETCLNLHLTEAIAKIELYEINENYKKERNET